MDLLGRLARPSLNENDVVLTMDLLWATHAVDPVTNSPPLTGNDEIVVLIIALNSESITAKERGS